ncbi:MAG: class I SAM-dependent methyltransferase [Anaerolineae bacterium]|nr:class I SAM-dependent methyltransferase [Thermoflexales bacterium]MDW8408808.1 class I SAM-dependent methyltransferase [Anaerolineae bacterium]
MLQPYNRTFPRAYNRFWSAFANEHAPRIAEFYERTATGQADRTVLDLCCGTGQLAAHFLRRGYRVVGIDLSEAMLEIARENCAPYLATGQVRFIQADASNFAVDHTFGLVVSTYDALNHLPSFEALGSCFGAVSRALAPGGWFIFDLNTRSGLRRWNNIRVIEMDDMVVIDRGIYDGQSDRAYTFMTGFLRTADGLYERFEQFAYNTVFDLAKIKTALIDAGLHVTHFARGQDLNTPVDDPEREERIFILSSKAGTSAQD